MMYRLLLSTALLAAAGCAGLQPNERTHESCGAVFPYSGGALRAPVDASTFALNVNQTSGLTLEERARLEAAFDRSLEATDAPTMTVAVWQAGGSPWSRESGTPAGHVHYWGSVGKLVTSVAIMKLMEQGRLSLEDPVSNYIQGVPNGEIITLRMLLNHTAGLHSADATEEMRDNGLQLDLENVLRIINERAPYGCPGEESIYSNTHYILLSSVIEEVSDQPYHIAAYDLALANTAGRDVRLVGPDSSLDRVVLPQEQPGLPIWDVRQPRGAGVALASADDMALFLRDLMSGRILEIETVEQMLAEIYPTFPEIMSYGLGITTYDLPPSEGSKFFIGHTGGAPGARGLLVYSPEKQAIIAVALTGNGSVEATVNLLDRALDEN